MAALDSLRDDLREHRNDFQRFRNEDFGAMRERVAKVEVRAGMVAALVAAIVAAVGAWVQ